MPWMPGTNQRRNTPERNPKIRDVWETQRLATTHIAALHSRMSSLETQLTGLAGQVDELARILQATFDTIRDGLDEVRGGL